MKTLTPIFEKPHSFACLNQPITSQDLSIKNFMGKSKWQIKQNLLRLNIEFVEFVHWLAVPSLDILCHFDHQICIAIDTNCYNKIKAIA